MNILKDFSNNKMINFDASRYRLKIIINNLDLPLIITFGGNNSGLCNNMNIDDIDRNVLNKNPNYMEETFKNNKNYNYVFIVDLYQVWGTIDFDNILKSLQNIIQYYGPKKIMCIGQSSGGYMSILFGNLIKAHKIMAFVPQINIFDSCNEMNRFRHELKNKYKLLKFSYKNLNTLQPFISKTKIYLCSYTHDIIQINYLDKNDKNLIINCVSNKNTHNIVSVMGKENFIKLIMSEISTL